MTITTQGFSNVVRVLAAAVALLGCSFANAQAYPTKPVTMIVPFSAGGPTDVVARSIGQAMSKNLGQSVIVENAAGAGGSVGAGRVKQAAADGHTILLHHIAMSTMPSLYRKLAFNPQTDFEMVGLVVDVPMTLVARADFPAANFQEFLKYVRANKDKMNLANAGVGSASHLCGLLFMSAVETDFTTVPFRGTADAMNALLGKQVDFMCDQTTNTTGQLQAKTIKAYGVTTAKRLTTMPDMPTLQEAGLKDFEVGVWHGIYAPKGTPKPVIDRLVAALQAGAKDADFVKRMSELGAIVYPVDQMTPAALSAKLKEQTERWGAVIQKAGQYAD